MFNNTNIRTRLLISFLTIGIFPFALLGLVSLYEGRHALSNQAFNHLESVREVKKAQLESFFEERHSDMQALLNVLTILKQNAYQKLQSVQENKKSQLEWYFAEHLRDLSTLSKSELPAQALDQFDGAFQTEGQKTGGLAWSSAEEHFGGELTRFQTEHGYQDLLLITKKGDIVYSTTKGTDLGQNVLSEAWPDPALTQAFQVGLEKMTLQDFASYTPAKRQHVAFLVAPLWRFDEIIGVIALRFAADAINTIVQERQGMGETGETYLVGRDSDNRTSYRSDRIIYAKGEAVVGHPKAGEDIDKALAGQSGIAIKRGIAKNLVLGAYSPLNIPNLHWCIITTIALEELLTPKLVGEQADFFGKYVNQYGYYDLFLIHPNGDIFYTVKHEDDYNTNILHGKYADTHLNQLVQTVLRTKTFGLSDFAIYPPSRGIPSAFMVQPLLDSQGTVELVIALQLPHVTLNRILGERAGMGDSGETYLVGVDKLIRTDSFLDAQHYSTRTSFANSTQRQIHTDSVQAALQGQTGRAEITNYLGTKVLSAYAPVTVGNITWALIAEVSQAEAFAAIYRLEWLTVGIGGLGIAIIIFVSLTLTRGITVPLNEVVKVIRQLAKGQLVLDELPNHSSSKQLKQENEVNEIAVMQRAVHELSLSLQQMITDLQHTVESARNGDLTQRVATTSLCGFMKDLGDSANQLVATNLQVMEEVTRVVNALAAGRLNERMKMNHHGMYALVSQSIQTTIENLQKIIAEIQEVVECAGHGEFDTLIQLANKQGFSWDLSISVNAIVEIQRDFSEDVSRLLGNMKEGDLTQPLARQYAGEFERVKQNANETIAKWVAMLGQIKHSAEIVRQAAVELETGHRSLAERTETQAASLEETAASMEEITAAVQQNAQNAQLANHLAQAATEVANRGSEAVNLVVDKMQQISFSSKRIGAIIDVINGIAFQTNMLALNAAVEAARAGTQGRGFAVVATEVRSLAQRSAEAAKEISHLIDESVANVEAGHQLVAQAGETMQEILTSIQKVKNIMAEISSASSEQSQGIKQVNVAITQMDDMTQRNSALVAEATANTTKLAEQVVWLQEAVGQFRF